MVQEKVIAGACVSVISCVAAWSDALLPPLQLLAALVATISGMTALAVRFKDQLAQLRAALRKLRGKK